MDLIFEKIKIISGGQTGVDRAALDFAIQHKLHYGGWCTNGRLAEDGIINMKYNLIETNTKLFIHRTYLNVRDTDATLLIFQDELDEGSELTELFCLHLSKPYRLFNLKNFNAHTILQWFKKNNFKSINFAGPRESNSPGIYTKTIEALIQLK